MATRKRAGKAANGDHSALEQALVSLINNQAMFVANMARSDERFARMDERFARIESELAEIKAILREHERILLNHQAILEALPEAIREKIGFVKPQ